MPCMSRWRTLIVVLMTGCVSIAGISLLLAVNAEVSAEAVAAVAGPADTKGSPMRTERISPPGATRPPPRPLPSAVPPGRGADPVPPPTFRMGGFPPMGVPGPMMGAEAMPPQGEEDDGDLQRQLATRRLAALERRVRAMSRRIHNMGDRGSTAEQVQSQKERMETLLDEIRQKREEQGLPPFQIEDEEPAN